MKNEFCLEKYVINISESLLWIKKHNLKTIKIYKNNLFFIKKKKTKKYSFKYG